MDPATMALIMAGLTGAQTGVNSAVSAGNVNATNTANLNLAKYQYSNEIDMWNKANAYNTPAAQMQRFKDAGLNPNLIYGQGSSGNSPNVLPQYHAPTQRYDYEPSVNLPQMLSSYLDTKIKSAQVDQTKANADNARWDTVLKGLDALDKNARNIYNFGGKYINPEYGSSGALNVTYGSEQALKSYQADILSETVNDQIRKIKLANEQAEANIPQVESLTKYRGKETDWYDTMKKWGIINGALGGATNAIRSIK